jgi:uncharacterized protein involved in exopolysaccharide biosynthesis
MTALSQPQIISRRALDLEDYIDIARRHMSWIIGPLYAGIAISTMIAFFLPNVYVSRAMLRITPSEVNQTVAPVTSDRLMSDRISAMWQDVVSRDNLSTLIERPALDLYRPERNRMPLADVVEEMRNKDLRMEVAGSQQANGKPSSAFIVSFEYPDRVKAHAVVAAVVTKLMDISQIDKGKGPGMALSLINEEVQTARDVLEKVDREITAFRMANAGRLPEQFQSNANAMSSLQSRLTSLNDALSRNAQESLIRESNLSSLKARYSQLKQLADGSEPAREAPAKNQDLERVDREIQDKQAQLVALRRKYTNQHPEVLDAKADLDLLNERRIQVLKENRSAPAGARETAAANPLSAQNQQTLTQAKAEVDSADAILRALELDRVDKQKEIERITADLKGFQSRFEAAPGSEQQYMALMGERSVAAQNYAELQRKQQAVMQGKKVTDSNAGESLEVLDTASLPETPTAPHRWQIVGFGALAGLLIGIATAGVKEMKDTSLKNLKDVRVYTNLAVLSSIPLLENAALLQRQRRMAYLAWSAAILIGLTGTAISLYYHLQISGK